MEEQILNSMIQQGAFAALFVWMLITTQKKNEQREEQAKAFSSLAKDLSDVKQKILGHGDMK
ncbi:bacteriocin biosynthesis protein [Bacillus toyonensis]|uniref:BhlA/UviB family holin-like peptide n=1 Tax=Bacillus toyonensis TaxID=155322 RepID=UPI000BF07CC2|nr:BhlA/UviB family holin-like peptide [Bacillus toyonensis]PEK86111.1 bacteriocin biosynthesis protein [Bacillus toyonensis]PGD19828.1 bacteriocin biosynthesis protein [Bacillus toyonensis]PHD49277.1 bacteriocin biosynthesis protein [Bacillus toyonensis]